MSQRTRNPFKLRATEKIDSETTFLRLYSPAILEELFEKFNANNLWDDVLFIRSSPGAGKSSLLRIFDPSTLVTLFNNKSNQLLRDLREMLKRIGVMDNTEIKLLGISLQCNRNYEILEDLPIDDVKKKRFFFALINARIILSTLRGILSLKSLEFPADLDKIGIDYSESSSDFSSLNFPCTGRDLYQWAENIESRVYKALDSFLPIEQIQPEGHTEIFSFSLVEKAIFSIDKSELKIRKLFMFDDTHKLSRQQRSFLVRYVAEHRKYYSIWVAERLEALSDDENLRSYYDRDYNEINLESIWQKKESKFKNIVSNIASRRASASTEDLPEFEQNLAEGLNEAAFNEDFVRASTTIIKRLENIAQHTKRFNEWIDYLKKSDFPPLEKAILARSAEILAYKNISQLQGTFDLGLTRQELEASVTSTIQNFAEYFLAHEFKLPYYFGFEKVVQVSSYNIDQFLQFSSELYEGMLSNRLSARAGSVITAEDQNKIIRRVVNEKWNDLSRLIPYAEQVKSFLQKFHEMALKETNRPTIPYPPGVTGFAIRDKAEPILITEPVWMDNEVYKPLVNVLSTCISFNLLEKRKVSQGKKGSDTTTVFYLNRWLCVRFNLPFGYGGWRHIKSGELLKWCK